jgi:hypothetical protein
MGLPHQTMKQKHRKFLTRPVILDFLLLALAHQLALAQEPGSVRFPPQSKRLLSLESREGQLLHRRPRQTLTPYHWLVASVLHREHLCHHSTPDPSNQRLRNGGRDPGDGLSIGARRRKTLASPQWIELLSRVIAGVKFVDGVELNETTKAA